MTHARQHAVRNLVAAAARLYERRAALIEPIAASTGLSPQGVEWGFGCLEREVTPDALQSLLGRAADAAQVHVILSANVFVAPLRALAMARASAPIVTVRPSPRDPWLTRALVEEAADPGLALVAERDMSRCAADCIHVYGRRETLDAVRAQAPPGTRIIGHGPGFGIAVVTRDAHRQAAEAIASDVVAFDQRGCLSPRIVLVEGSPAAAEALAVGLHAALEDLDVRVPRGELSPEEAQEGRRWVDALTFAGRIWTGTGHAVAMGATLHARALPPAGRHVLVVPAPTLDAIPNALGPLGAFVVTVGSDAPARIERAVPAQARLSLLGQMQRPPLDGPVDRRA